MVSRTVLIGLNVGTIILQLASFFVVWLNVNGYDILRDYLSPTFMRQGFCVWGEKDGLIHSFTICFVFDLFTAIYLYRSSCQLGTDNYMPVFAHGCLHLWVISFKLKQNTEKEKKMGV